MMAVTAVYKEGADIIYTESVYQHDVGQYLLFEGLTLPEVYEVHFSNTKDQGVSVAIRGTPNGVPIPNAFLSTGMYVYAFVNIPGDEGNMIRTAFTVVIPVITRPAPIYGVVTESETTIRYEVDPEMENLHFTGVIQKPT